MKPDEYGVKWEKLGVDCDRLAIPGGWIVRAYATVKQRRHDPDGRIGFGNIDVMGEDRFVSAMLFVPDPDHAWAKKLEER